MKKLSNIEAKLKNSVAYEKTLQLLNCKYLMSVSLFKVLIGDSMQS